LDAVQATREIMRAAPCSILLLAGSDQARPGPIFDALSAGAVDVVSVPDSNGGRSAPGRDALLAKLDVLRRLGPREGARPRVGQPNGAEPSPRRLLVVGASAGGPGALAVVLAALPRDLPTPVVIVQHIDAQFAATMAVWLATQCALPVHTAEEDSRLQPGHVYLAARNDHLILRGRDTLGYTPAPVDVPYRPSIDVCFRSVARHWHADAIGVLLTGMGRDGAAGLRTLRDAGALTIAQDQESSVVYGIPKAAAEMDAAVEILPLTRIAPRILRALSMNAAHPTS